MKLTTRLNIQLRMMILTPVLTIVWMVCFVAASSLAIPQDMVGQSPQVQASALTQALIAVAFLNAAVLTFIILRSRWYGWQLALALFVLIFGVYTVISQIETMAFPAVANRLPSGLLPRFFLQGAILAMLFSPVAVFICGKWKRELVASPAELNTRLDMSRREWVWKLVIIAIAYSVIYFTFGYYVAWRNPAVAAYYNGADPGSFLAQIGSVMRDTPWLPFFQMLRGILWALLALPVIRMMEGPVWETSLAVGLLFAIVMNAQLLFPNPYMPDAVRLTHLVETASSNFLFGLLLTGLILWHPPGGRVLTRPAQSCSESGRRTTSLRPAPLRTVRASLPAHGSSKPLGISAQSVRASGFSSGIGCCTFTAFSTMYLLVAVEVDECRVLPHVHASLASRLQVMGV